jgi:hypothetical protein
MVKVVEQNGQLSLSWFGIHWDLGTSMMET